jgi:hypothetical protein
VPAEEPPPVPAEEPPVASQPPVLVEEPPQPSAMAAEEQSVVEVEKAQPRELDSWFSAATFKDDIVAVYQSQERAALTITNMSLLRNEMQLCKASLDDDAQFAADEALAVSTLAQECSNVYSRQRLAQAVALQALHSLACSTSRVEALGTSAAQVAAEATVAKFRQLHLQKAALDKALQRPQSDTFPLEDQLFAAMSEASNTARRAAAFSAAAACATSMQLAGQRTALRALSQLDALRRDAAAKFELFMRLSEKLAQMHRGLQSHLDDALVAMQQSIEGVASLNGDEGTRDAESLQESLFSYEALNVQRK